MEAGEGDMKFWKIFLISVQSWAVQCVQSAVLHLTKTIPVSSKQPFTEETFQPLDKTSIVNWRLKCIFMKISEKCIELISDWAEERRTNVPHLYPSPRVAGLLVFSKASRHIAAVNKSFFKGNFKDFLLIS